MTTKTNTPKMTRLEAINLFDSSKWIRKMLEIAATERGLQRRIGPLQETIQCLTELGFIYPTLLGWHATDSGREALAGNL